MAERTYHPTHDMVLREDGSVDIWQVGESRHNGPRCQKCGAWCHHCETKRAERPCPVVPDLRLEVLLQRASGEEAGLTNT